MKSKPRRYAAEMTPAELESLVAGLDSPGLIDRSTPLTKDQAAAWKRAKRRRGRPRIGKGAAVISVSIERDLLKRSDRLAKKLRISRAGLIASGLERMLAVSDKAALPGSGRTRRRPSSRSAA